MMNRIPREYEKIAEDSLKTVNELSAYDQRCLHEDGWDNLRIGTLRKERLAWPGQFQER